MNEKKKHCERAAHGLMDAAPDATGDASTLSPEAGKAMKSVKRTKEEIREGLAVDGVDAFTLQHHSLGTSFLPVAGPFDDSETAKEIQDA